MVRRTQTYAIRLAVEGGGQVNAELVSVGQSGEQSLKRIEAAGERASGGPQGPGAARRSYCERASARWAARSPASLRLAVSPRWSTARSSSADAIGETGSKIGVGVEALQELRFAASLAGVEQQTLRMALQRFTCRAAEAAQGAGKPKDARPPRGAGRAGEACLQAIRLRGVALVNLLTDGGGALEEMREPARDLAGALDEDLVSDAERAQTELNTAGSGLLPPDEMPIIARRGELVVPPERIVREEKSAREQRSITVAVNVTAVDANSFRAKQAQIAADMACAIDRAGIGRVRLAREAATVAVPTVPGVLAAGILFHDLGRLPPQPRR